MRVDPEVASEQGHVVLLDMLILVMLKEVMQVIQDEAAAGEILAEIGL
jgi:hypothetical protein